jgi:hypothetical protein
MTGDEDGFVVWFISAQPAKKQPIINATITHFDFSTCFLPFFFLAIPPASAPLAEALQRAKNAI